MVDTVTAAFLSKEIYRSDLIEGQPIDSQGRFIVSETSPANITGYFGAIIEDTVLGEAILVSRGTEITDLQDLSSNINVGLGWIPTQFSSAESFYED